MFGSHSLATTTRSNRGFQLSPRMRLSQMMIQNPPRRLHPLQRKRNCKSYTSVSDPNRYRRRKNLVAPAPAAHDDHLMPGYIAQPQLPIPFLPADQKRKREARVERTTVKIIFTNLQQNKKRLAFEQQD